MRTPHPQRPRWPSLLLLILAAWAIPAWLAAVVSRALDFIDVPWWVVLSPLLLVAAVFLLYVAGALALAACFTLSARWRERRTHARHAAEARRVKQSFDRGLHLLDSRRDQPPHRW